MFMFKSSTLFAAASGVAISVLSQVAGAAYVVGPIDFSTYTNNATVIGQQGWASYGSTDPNVATIQNDSTGSGRGQLLYIDNHYASGAWIDIPNAYRQDSTQIMRVKYDIYGPAASSTHTMGQLQVGDIGGSDWAAGYVEGMGPSYGSAFRVNGTNAYFVPNVVCQEDTWYTVTLDLSWADKTYDVTITDGTTSGTLTDVPFWYNSLGYPVPALKAVYFHDSAAAGDYGHSFVDNVSVEMIPEPASLSLLGLGALALRRRK